MKQFQVIIVDRETKNKTTCDISVPGSVAPQQLRKEFLLKMPEKDITVIQRTWLQRG